MGTPAEHVINITHGKAEFVYDDQLADVTRDMGGTVTRASHVEPHPTKPGWLADMRPSGGPILGDGCEYACRTLTESQHGLGTFETVMGQAMALVPFATREEALAAERVWLREHRGL